MLVLLKVLVIFRVTCLVIKGFGFRRHINITSLRVAPLHVKLWILFKASHRVSVCHHEQINMTWLKKTLWLEFYDGLYFLHVYVE